MTHRKMRNYLLSIHLHKFSYVVFLLMALFACKTSLRTGNNYTYFTIGADTIDLQQTESVIKPNDLLSIQVYSNSLNQEQAAVFNVPLIANGSSIGYQVTLSGTIEMPIIGTLKVKGITKQQLQTVLVQKLASYVKDPSVIVRSLQFNVNVLGEVTAPGAQKFNQDRVTIIDAISAAGDLTDFGRREDVKVIREDGKKRIYHTIDLRSKAIFESPVYILQPNDIVYVGPNKFKLKNLNVDQEKQRKTSVFFSVFSAIISVATLIIFSIR